MQDVGEQQPWIALLTGAPRFCRSRFSQPRPKSHASFWVCPELFDGTVQVVSACAPSGLTSGLREALHFGPEPLAALVQHLERRPG